jgi:4-aminobutyrate aminotransferase-like enzyme
MNNKYIYKKVKNLIDLNYYIPVAFKNGLGAIINDLEDKEYIDFSSGYGVSIIGWQHPDMIEFQKEQINKSIYAPTWMPTEESVSFAEKLLSLFKNKDFKCLKATGGANANEVALSVFYNINQGDIATFKNSYHGWSQATLGMGEISQFKMPKVKKEYITHKISFPDVDPEIDENESLKELEHLLQNNSNIKIFIGELALGAGGVYIPSKDYWKKFSEICKKFSVYLIIDEAITGFGRTGEMFLTQYYDIDPDAITFAKGISSGYAAIGAVLIKSEHLKKYNFSDVGASFAWSPYSCAIAEKNINIIQEKNLAQNSENLGKFLKTELEKIFYSRLKSYNFKIRGKGLMLAISPSNNHIKIIGRIFFESLKGGLITNISGDGKSIIILPPLILDKEKATKGVEILEKVIKKLDINQHIMYNLER